MINKILLSAIGFLIIPFFCYNTNAITPVYSTSYSFNFENDDDLSSIEGVNLSISNKHYKKGSKSLLWNWSNEENKIQILSTKIQEVNTKFANRSGLKMWIYCETSYDNPITINFKNDDNQIIYTFDFNLSFTGWRACWIAFKDMWQQDGSQTQMEDISKMEIVAPKNIVSGNLWIDRLEFTTYIDKQACADAQIPENNRFVAAGAWHWGLLDRWERIPYDMDLKENLSQEELNDIAKIESNLKSNLVIKKLSATDLTTLNNLVNETIGLTDEGKGAPLIHKDYLEKGDVSLLDLNNLLNISYRAWYEKKDDSYRKIFMNGVRYMLDQGFAYGSCMGTNHHYGYSTRDIFSAIYWMKDPLKEEGLWNDAFKAVTYWSGLAETRIPYDKTRCGITDAWNTLQQAKLLCAIQIDNILEKERALRGLARWTNQSLLSTPGTVGGIKVDGTSFHHGVHYPGYSAPGLGSVGTYLNFVNGTYFGIDEEAFLSAKKALQCLRNHSNTQDWGLGVCGRSPFSGKLSNECINAFGYFAKSQSPVDVELAADFIRLKEGTKCNTADIRMKKDFVNAGIQSAAAPKGFFPYNYSCLGVFRYNGKLVNIKGLTSTIWGSEIFYDSNRFGRYQGYGSIQIIGAKSPEAIEEGYPYTENASRFKAEGWDWNRVPGTTTIHLPLSKLNSSVNGDDLVRQNKHFAGSTSLDNQTGLFAMSMSETRYNSHFLFNKSVFCFGNQIVCLGSNISNSEKMYPTETTLFQSSLLNTDEEITINEEKIDAFPYSANLTESTILTDPINNYYYIPNGQHIEVYKQEQTSKDHSNKTNTKGNFASAILSHGVNPQSQGYEYMITLDASDEQVNRMRQNNLPYQVISKEAGVHILKDMDSNTYAYAFFDVYQNENDNYILKADKEMVSLVQPSSEGLKLSACSPDLNLDTYIYNNPQESPFITKTILLKGQWSISDNQENVIVTTETDKTKISCSFKDGLPIQLRLVPLTHVQNTSDDHKPFSVEQQKNKILIKGDQAEISIFNSNGVLLNSFVKGSGDFIYDLPTKGLLLVTIKNKAYTETMKIFN